MTFLELNVNVHGNFLKNYIELIWKDKVLKK